MVIVLVGSRQIAKSYQFLALVSLHVFDPRGGVLLGKWMLTFKENIVKKIDRLNRLIAGTGYQFLQTRTKVRIENECGDFLRYSATIKSAIKRYIPNGCGGRSLENLLAMV
jgi:hypothetical protein